MMTTTIPLVPSASQPQPPKRKPGRPPGFTQKITRPIDYSCSECGAATPKENLLAKRVSFARVGKGGKLVRSRTVSWLCPECVEKDPAWAREALVDAPGTTQEVDRA